MPVIGIEPALKPAVHAKEHPRVLVLATPMTLREEKFQALMQKFEAEAEILPLPCPGLVEFVEQGELDGNRLENFLQELFAPYVKIPVALEGALKLKEVSYIHADGYPAAEMKHGPIALIDKTMPVLAIAIPDALYEKTASNVQEVKARGGVVISVVSNDDDVVSKMSDYAIRVPVTDPCLMPVLVSIPLQLFAYYIADAKGLDVDQPRNLAKSVTVE